MCCLPCCWTYDFTPALSNSWKALGWIDLTTKFRCKLFKPHVPWSQTDGIYQSHLVQRQTNGIRCVLTILNGLVSGDDFPSSTPWSSPDELRWAKPGLWRPEAQRDFDATAGFVWVSYFHTKIYVYIYIYTTQCVTIRCACVQCIIDIWYV